MDRDARNATLVLGALAAFGLIIYLMIQVGKRNEERDVAEPDALDRRFDDLSADVDAEVDAAMADMNDRMKEDVAESEARAAEFERQMGELGSGGEER